MTERWIDVEGARLAADVREGHGPAVVALHGLTSSRAAEDAGGHFGWDEVARAGRTLVRYDARSHGASTGRAVDGEHAWSALAGDLGAVLDVTTDGSPVDGIGVSMGTGTLLHAAVREPGRFRRLVLVLPPTAWATRAAQRDGYLAAARFIEQRGLEAFARGSASLPRPPLLDELDVPTMPPDVPEALLPSVLRGAAASDLPDEDAVAALRLPVLLLPWIGDPGHPLSTAERLAHLLPDARLEPMRTAADLRGAGARAAGFLVGR